MSSEQRGMKNETRLRYSLLNFFSDTWNFCGELFVWRAILNLKSLSLYAEYPNAYTIPITPALACCIVSSIR
mgnify:CR=1 FL=1